MVIPGITKRAFALLLSNARVAPFLYIHTTLFIKVNSTNEGAQHDDTHVNIVFAERVCCDD